MKVSIKDIPVRYNGKSYRKGDSLTINDEYFDKNIFVEVEGSKDIELSDLREEELKKVTKEQIKDYLDANEVEYDSRANKDELISLVLGEDTVGKEDGEPDEEGSSQE